jgi:hypothetical protein
VDGRFILHRHTDSDGPHHDLRIEMDGALHGWRILGDLDALSVAVEKAAHPLHWLDPASGDAAGMTCTDHGVYHWIERGRRTAVIRLHGRTGAKTLEIRTVDGLNPETEHVLRTLMNEHHLEEGEISGLIRDGLAARKRASLRLTGLARELDGEGFDTGLWRRISHGMTLDDIHAQLRGYEMRFDAKYPPQPVSRPESLEEGALRGTGAEVLELLRNQ